MLKVNPCFWILWASVATFAGQAATPPGQPKSGPGGADCSHQEVLAREYGAGAQAYWLFEPAQPTPASAPVIVFSHGWSAMNPHAYGAWIEHLVKRGSIVVYPVYQDNLRTPPRDFTPNAIAAVKDAIQRLQKEPGHVKPELDKFALAGHSMGGVLSANMAALWAEAGLPKPRAVMCVEPGKTWGVVKAIAITLEDLSRIPKETLLISVVGDNDNIAGSTDAKRIFRESTQIPLENKNFVTLVSDAHGQPALRANHFAPVLSNALNYYGTWKLLDALTDAAFYGRNRNFALGNTPEQRFMGRWSDGVPVKEMIISVSP